MFLMYPKPKRPTRESRKFPRFMMELVIQRDLQQIWLAARQPGSPMTPPQTLEASFACVAPLLDGAELGRCSGRITIQHVKEEIGMVPRKHREEMLLSLCRWHHLGHNAGANWATSHMDLQRAYLARLYPRFWHKYIERNAYASHP